MSNPTLESIYAFPFKGFPGQKLQSSKLSKGAGLPNDRRYAVTKGIEATGEWMPARSFYVVSRVDGMPKFTLEKADQKRVVLANPAGQKVEIRHDDPASISKANADIMAFMQHVGVASDGPWPEIIERNDKGGNWDYPDTAISIINASTVSEIGKTLGVDMDPLRYRGNLVIKGLPAWAEFGLKGKRLKLGDAELEVMRPIVRCPTPGVNPDTGDNDIEFEKLLPEHYGHAYCGMYAAVVKSGTITASEPIEMIGDAEMPVTQAAAEAEDYRLWPRLVEISFCEIGDISTRLSLRKFDPWPLPQASPGQRLRFHLGPDAWTTDYITAVSPGHYHLEIEKSATGDPVTEKLRTSYEAGKTLIVSGPFGKV